MWKTEQRASLLRQLYVLNRRFIDHLLEDFDDDPSASSRITFLPQLRTLDARALHEVCATPFTLYYLPFNDGAYWEKTAARCSANGGVASPRPVGERARHITKLTLFLAWHVACVDAASARLLFGMTSRTLHFLRGAQVAVLSDLALQAASLLQPRWPRNPFFWPDLLRAAGHDSVRLQATRLLGAQLLAAEMQSAPFASPAPRARPAIVRMTDAAIRSGTGGSSPAAV
jgi:hypothetical protein